MKIFFLLSGTIWVHTLPEGFIEAGHEVEISGSIFKSDIPKRISDFKPDFIISMGWGADQTKEGQLLTRKYSKEAKVPHIYWSIEDPAYTWDFSLPLIQRTQPDFVFSICTATVEYLRKLGLKSAHLDFGYAPKIHKKVDCEEIYKSRIAVVANAYPDKLKAYSGHYRHQSLQTLISPLLKEGIRVDFWGNHWNDAAAFVKHDIPPGWIHGYLPYRDANRVYSSAMILIGLQNYTHQLTQRTYEILASGGFLLTSDTPAVRSRFKVGEELVVSSSPEETSSLVTAYMGCPEKCMEIADNGCKSVMGDSYANRAKYMIEILKKEKIL